MGSPNKANSTPDLSCAGESKESCITLRKRKQRPECDCVVSTCNLNSSTVAREIADALKDFRCELDDKLSQINLNIINTIKAELNDLRTTSLEIKQDINALRVEHSSFKSQISQFENSLQFHTNEVDDLKKQVTDIATRTSSLHSMDNKIFSLEHKIESLEQQARLNNIEICNLPEKRDEDLSGLIQSIGAVIKCPIPRQDVLAIHRVPHARTQESNRPKNVIVKLASRDLRNNVLSAYRLTKNVSSNQIGISGTSHKIYINEHLTLYNKNLFRETREMASKYNVKYVWIKNATILLKATDTSKTFAVRCQNDISKIALCKQNE